MNNSQGYYNYIFFKRVINAEEISTIIYGIILLDFQNNPNCLLKIYMLREERIVNMPPVESSVHSSIYSINFLDNLIDQLSLRNDFDRIREHLKNTEGEDALILPALISYINIDIEEIFFVYTQIGEQKPWIIASPYPYKGKMINEQATDRENKIVKIGFVIVLPENIARRIESSCSSESRKSLTVEISYYRTQDGGENE